MIAGDITFLIYQGRFSPPLRPCQKDKVDETAKRNYKMYPNTIKYNYLLTNYYKYNNINTMRPLRSLRLNFLRDRQS